MRTGGLVAALLVLAVTAPAASAKEPKLTAREVIARHLDAIGTPESRAHVTSRVAEGATQLRILIGGAGDMSGRALLFSEAQDVRATLRFAAPDYRGESLGFVKDAVEIGMFRPGVRSEIAHFFFTHDEALRDGLLGGALSTAWPLYKEDLRGAKLDYEGLKKTAAGPRHELSYKAKKRSGIEVRLYFDETFRHVRTTYRLRVPPPMVNNSTASSSQQDSLYEAEELFDAFEAADGLTLPRGWTLRFSADGDRTTPSLWRFETRFDKLRENLALGGE